MNRIRFIYGCLMWVGAALPAQDDAMQLEAARHQLAQRHLDSALVLLHGVDHDRQAPAPERAAALQLEGVIRFYQGKDSAAAKAFRSALALDITTRPLPLMATESSLGALWLAQVASMAPPTYPPDTLFTCLPRCLGVDEAPKLIGGFDASRFTREWGVDRNQYGVRVDRGEATLRLTIDTLGHVEPGSAELVTSTLPRIVEDEIMSNYQDALFSPGRVRHRPVRVRLDFRFTVRPH